MVGAPKDARLIDLLARLIGAFLLSCLVGQKMIFFIANINQEDLTIVSELMTAGKVTPVIDRRFSLTEVPEALRYLEEGHAQGKVAITLEHSSET